MADKEIVLDGLAFSATIAGVGNFSEKLAGVFQRALQAASDLFKEDSEENAQQWAAAKNDIYEMMRTFKEFESYQKKVKPVIEALMWEHPLDGFAFQDTGSTKEITDTVAFAEEMRKRGVSTKDIIACCKIDLKKAAATMQMDDGDIVKDEDFRQFIDIKQKKPSMKMK